MECTLEECFGRDFELRNGYYYCTDCGTECYGQDFVDESFAEPRGEDSNSNDDLDDLENGYLDIESPENAENEEIENRDENVDWSALDDSHEDSIAEENNISNDAKKDK